MAEEHSRLWPDWLRGNGPDIPRRQSGAFRKEARVLWGAGNPVMDGSALRVRPQFFVGGLKTVAHGPEHIEQQPERHLFGHQLLERAFT